MNTGNIFWGVKADGTYGWQPYHLHEPIVLKSGSLNLLESSGPVQACNGIALPFNNGKIVDAMLLPKYHYVKCTKITKLLTKQFSSNLPFIQTTRPVL